MINKIKVWTMALTLLASAFVHAQSDSMITRKKFQFKLGAFYNSHLNYYGRTDSLQSSGFFPVAELMIDSNFYLNYIPVFVLNNASSFEYAGSVATAGFRFTKEKKYNASVYLVKPLYKHNSQLVQSALKMQLTGTYTWLNKIVNLTIGGDLKLSDDLDYGATASLDHVFRFQLTDKVIMVIDPSASVNAGTQRFTKTSYKQNGFLFLPGSQEEVNEAVSRFNILSYEFSAPIVLSKGKWQIIAVPAYVIPQNLIEVQGRPDLSERGSKMFYATAGIKLNF